MKSFIKKYIPKKIKWILQDLLYNEKFKNYELYIKHTKGCK